MSIFKNFIKKLKPKQKKKVPGEIKTDVVKKLALEESRIQEKLKADESPEKGVTYATKKVFSSTDIYADVYIFHSETDKKPKRYLLPIEIVQNKLIAFLSLDALNKYLDKRNLDELEEWKDYIILPRSQYVSYFYDIENEKLIKLYPYAIIFGKNVIIPISEISLSGGMMAEEGRLDFIVSIDEIIRIYKEAVYRWKEKSLQAKFLENSWVYILIIVIILIFVGVVFWINSGTVNSIVQASENFLKASQNYVSAIKNLVSKLK